MGTRNQKKMSDEEKEKIREGMVENQQRVLQDEQELEEIKEEILKEAFKLPMEINTKMQEVAQMLSAKSDIPYAKVYSLLSKKTPYAVRNTYSNDDLYFAFEHFKKIVDMITNKQQFIPTKNLFCAYLGISTNTFDGWLVASDDMRREIAKMVENYLVDVSLTLSQTRKAESFTSIFRAKAEFGMTEAVAPVIIEHRSGVNKEEIQTRLNMAKKGKILEAQFKDK